MKRLPFILLFLVSACGPGKETQPIQNKDEKTNQSTDWSWQELDSAKNRVHCQKVRDLERLDQAMSSINRDILTPYNVQIITQDLGENECWELFEISLKNILTEEKLKSLNPVALFEATER